MFKNLLILATLVSALASFSASASDYYFKIKTTWKDKNAPAGKTYFAVMEDKEFNTGTWILIFGNKNGKVKVRRFPIYSFYTYEGSTEITKDDFYTLKTKIIKSREVMAAELIPSRGTKNHKMTYKVHNSAASINFAKVAANIALKQIEVITNRKNPKNLREFKEILHLGAASMNDYDWDSEVMFPTAYLQIEAYFNDTKPNKTLKTAFIRKDGKDPISKKFRTSKKWYTADSAIDAIAENYANDVYQEDPYSYYNTKSTGFEGFESIGLINGAKKFVRYEIVDIMGLECEDSEYDEKSFTWILTDGSTFTYGQGTECD